MAIGDEFSLDSALNTSQIYNGIWDSIPQRMMDSFYSLFNLGKVALIFGIIYVIVLIFVKLIGLFFGSKEICPIISLSNSSTRSNALVPL